MFDQAHAIGMPQERLATLLGLERHRLSRWRAQKIKGCLEDSLPGSRQAPHRLLPEEREAFLALAAREDLADASVPVLCAYGSDTDVVYLSPSTGYRLLKEAHLSEPRGSARHRHPLPRIHHDLAVVITGENRTLPSDGDGIGFDSAQIDVIDQVAASQRPALDRAVIAGSEQLVTVGRPRDRNHVHRVTFEANL